MACTVAPCGRPVASCSTVLASASSASASASSCAPPCLLRTGFSGTRLRIAADIRPCYTPSSFEIFAISSNDFRPGTNIELDNAPWRVQEFLHVKPGKGAAFVRTKLRNYITGNTVERTFRAGESVDEANVVKEFKQFTYVDGDQYVFMDMTSYEEARLSLSDLADKTKFLKEGMECAVLSWNGRVIDVELPITVKLTVTQTDPGLKGDTAQGGSKPATVDTGAVVTVPLFVNTGDVIMVDTRTGTYMSRA